MSALSFALLAIAINGTVGDAAHGVPSPATTNPSGDCAPLPGRTMYFLKSSRIIPVPPNDIQAYFEREEWQRKYAGWKAETGRKKPNKNGE